MFCAKCGAQISESDQFCPKCGKENTNFVGLNDGLRDNIIAIKTKATSFWTKVNEKDTAGKKKWLRPVIILGALVVIGIAGFALLSNVGISLFSPSGSRITWSPNGISGYADTAGAVYFVDAGEARSFKGKYSSGCSTPDHSKYLVSSEAGEVEIYDVKKGADESTTIDEKAGSILTVNNDGFFYTSKAQKRLYYYSFSEKTSVDTGMKNCSYKHSRNGNTVVGITESGEISIFTKGDTAAKTLCSVDEDAYICCVADDGSNVIWSVEDGSTFGIYMLKNGAPERIGKITNAEEFSYVYGFFYNNDRSFAVCSDESAQMVVGKDGIVKELVLPGVLFSSFFDRNGQSIDSDDDNIEEPYLIIQKTRNSSTGGLYKLSKEGDFVLETDDINLDNRWNHARSYYIRNNAVYYINKDGDLFKKQLGEENDTVPITTDVKAFYIPEQGKYCYIVKGGSLYYIDLTNKEYKLNQIWNNLKEDDKIHLTDKPDVLYFITNMQKISDSYRTKGTLYKYAVGSEPKEIAKNIMYVQSGDAKNVSADHPIIEQYESNDEYDFILNVGTCIEGEYKELIKAVKD